MGSLFQDVRYGLRSLARSPGFTAIVVCTLAVGIAANTSIFSVIEAVILRPLPYRDPGQIVLVANSQEPEEGGLLYRDIEFLKAENQSLQDIATYYRDSGFSRVTLAGADGPLSVQGAFTTANLFPLLGVPTSLGRVFTPEEEKRKERVVVLSNGLWITHFGAARDVVGRMLQIDGFSFQVVGVMPATFQFPAKDQQFWAPITTNRYWGDPALTTNPDSYHTSGFYQRWQAMGRLKPGRQLRQAQVELNTILGGIRQLANDGNQGSGVSLFPLRVVLGGNTRLAFNVLFIAVGFVLLIACSNVANLLLARGATREREILVRAALGANRNRLARQLFTESVLLATLSGCLGLMLVPLGVRSLLRLAPSDIPRLDEAGVDPGVLVFALAISLIAALLFGVVPAWKISGTIGPLSASGTGIRSRAGLKRTHGLLVVGEFAIATVLLSGAGLLVRSFLAVESVDPGFQPEHILTMNISLPGASPERTTDVYNAVLERVRALPGVHAAGAVDSLFDLGRISNLGLRSVEGRIPEPQQRWTPLRWAAVRGDYFQAMGVQLLEGRYFTSQDGPNSLLVAMIDESMARRYWPNEDAIGKRFKGQDPRGKSDDWLTVVGIIRDMRRSGLERAPIPHVYEPYTQAIDGYRTSDLVARVTGPPGALTKPLRALVREIDPSAILSSVTTMEQQLSEQLSPRRFQATLLAVFSGVALLLAAVGIYGLLHYSVARRTHEIGIRMALGAHPHEVVWLLIRDGAKLAVAGLAIGVMAATAVTRLMQRLFFGVGVTDPATFVSVGMVLMTVALLACYIPARRAAHVDPTEALRYE